MPLWLRISVDGNYFGGLFGAYSTGSTYEVISRTGIVQFITSSGCWPSMPYDNSRRLVHTLADHDRWEVTAFVKGDEYGSADTTIATQPSDTGSIALIGGQFSELRIASYCTDIFLLVTGSGDNGTGAIRIVKTDSTLVKCTGAFTMPLSGSVSHHADVWVGGDSTLTAVVQKPRQKTPASLKAGSVFATDFYTTSGRKVATSQYRGKGGIVGLPAGIYVSVNREKSLPAKAILNAR
jgi:hypothetical protein